MHIDGLTIILDLNVLIQTLSFSLLKEGTTAKDV